MPTIAGRSLRAHLDIGGWPTWLLANITTALTYFALGVVVNAFFSAYGLFPAPIWLPAAVAVVAAMAGEMRLCPGIFGGSFIVNTVVFAAPVHVATIISLTNTLGPVAAAITLRRMRPATGLFTSFSGVIRFLLCAMALNPAITATGGVIAMAIGQPFNWLQFYTMWVGWWLCDAGGTLYLAPALLLWLGLEDPEGAIGGTELTRRYLAVWGAIAVFTAVLFLSPPLHGNALRPVLPFLLVMPLSWIALRMSLRSAYTLILLVAVIAASGTIAGLGAFNDPGIPNPLRMVGTLIVMLAMDVLTTVALVSEVRRAQDENRSKSMFLATTSHELRSPLNAIIGFSQMIDAQTLGPVGNPKYTEYAGLIHTAGQHLLGMINGLLDLAKIEAGQLAISEQPVLVIGVVEEALALVRFQAQAKAITLAVNIGPEIEAIHADGTALRQILLNLLGNAVKFTREGGNIEVAGRRGRSGELFLTVSDDGIGIPADKVEAVFTPFERVHNPGVPDVEGTGLGLSITRALVQLHGGTIRLESEPGRGTMAIVTFPAERLRQGEIVGFAEAAD